MPDTRGRAPRLLYVVEQYPELSQTFVTEEVRWVRDAGVDVQVVPVRPVRVPGEAVPGVASLEIPLSRPGPSEVVRAMLEVSRRRPGAAARAVQAAVADWIPRRQMDLYQALVILGRLDVLPDRVHAHFAMRGASVGSLVARALEVPFSFTAHAYDIFEYRRDTERIHAVADVQIAVCDYNATYQRQHWPEVADPVVVPCGVDTERFAMRDLGAVARDHVVAVARLVEKKGLSDLVEAVRLLRDRGRNVRCTVVGEGPERGRLEAQIQDAALDGVVVLAGALRHDEVRDILATAGVFAMPSVVASSGDRDSQPVVVKEALAVGVPCVVTDEVGLPEVVTSSSGWVVPPGDPARLAGALETALTLPDEEYEQRCLAARERALHFSFEVTIPRLTHLLGLAGGPGV